MDIRINKENIVLWFELLAEPAEQPYGKIVKPILIGVNNLGKDFSLRLERLEGSTSQMARRLCDSYGERIRSL